MITSPKQDRSLVRTASDLEKKYNLSSLVDIKKAVEIQAEGINKTNAELEQFMTSTVGDIERLQNEIDGNITTYFYSGVPSLSNLPASEWQESEYNIHLGDLYYDSETGHAYRFAKQEDTYLWFQITDVDVVEALALASEAKDTADKKRRVFTTTPFVPYDIGDLWLNNEELYVCKTSSIEAYDVSHWEKAVKYTDDTALNTFISGEYADDLTEINNSIDKKAETWYQSTDPSTNWTTNELKTAHVGDLWYNTTENKNYTYTSSYTWQEIDGVPDSVYDEIDGKAQIFTSQPTVPYHKGDLYTQGTNGDILVSTVDRLTGSYTASDWIKAGKYTDDTSLNNFVNNVYPEDLAELTNQIDSKITTWYYSGMPTLENTPANEWQETDYIKHTGDLYYDKETGYTYTFQLTDGVYGWVHIVDSDLTEALAIANAASDTADSKRRVFIAQPEPPYDNGDLWLNDGEIFVCQISKASGETFATDDFIIATKYTDDTLATQIGNELTVVRGTVTTIKESQDEFRISLDTTTKLIDQNKQEVDSILENMTYSFGTKDLTIASSTDPVNSRFNNQGVKVYTYKELNSIFNHNGTGIQKLIVVGDSQIANLKITKAVDEDGNACTDFHHLISNIQSLSDLED